MIGINENIIKQIISNVHSFEIDVSFLNIIMTIKLNKRNSVIIIKILR